MDSTAVNTNVTIDDFDSVLAYDDQAVWVTPDPSSPTFNASASPWMRGTYHQTETKAASLSFNFTGPAIYIYGLLGPGQGSFEVDIDSVASTHSAYQTVNATSSSLLYFASNLTFANHNLVLRNLGAVSSNGDKGGNAFLLDYISTTIQLAPAGATVQNKTYQEDDLAVTYTGTWGHNTSPAFSGGGTSYTNADQASASLSFYGSAVYVMGDKKDDHGIYSVQLDSNSPLFYDGVSGCGGAFGLTCEQQVPTLKFLASNLDSSQHTLKVTNFAGVNQSYFDLDSIVVAIPSVYAPRQLSNSSSPFVNGTTGSTTPSHTASVSSSSGGAAKSSAAAPAISNPLLLLVFTMLLAYRNFRR